jgi:hypothetical protein
MKVSEIRNGCAVSAGRGDSDTRQGARMGALEKP